jgi:hypothetical protein
MVRQQVRWTGTIFVSVWRKCSRVSQFQKYELIIRKSKTEQRCGKKSTSRLPTTKGNTILQVDTIFPTNFRKIFFKVSTYRSATLPLPAWLHASLGCEAATMTPINAHVDLLQLAPSERPTNTPLVGKLGKCHHPRPRSMVHFQRLSDQDHSLN